MTLNDDLPFYISPLIKQQLEKGRDKVLKADQDRIYIVTGREGLGKSKLARQLSYVCDSTMDLSRIVFTPKEFHKAVVRAKRGQAIIFDECFNGLSSKSSISKENKQLVRLLMECRSKNLFIFLVLPSFFLLEKYAALFRATALFNVLASRKNFKLRYYKVYNYRDKRLLYILGKGLMDYSKPKIFLSHRFYNKEIPTVDYDAYVKKKNSFFNYHGDDEPEETKHMLQRGVFSYTLKEKYGLSYVSQAKLLKKYGCHVVPHVLSHYAKDVPKKSKIVDPLV